MNGDARYKKSLNLYEEIFGTSAPEKLWPRGINWDDSDTESDPGCDSDRGESGRASVKNSQSSHGTKLSLSHVKKASTNFSCIICSFSFSRSQQLDVHYDTRHNKAFKCLFSDGEKISVNGNNCKCSRCNMHFLRPSALIRHALECKK